MSQSSIGSYSTALSPQALTGSTSRHHHNTLLDTAAKALGLTKSDLISQLKSGRSLDEVAAAAGVSHDDLAAAIKADMPPDVASASDSDDLVNGILSRRGLPERPTPPSAPPSDPSTGGATSSHSITGVLGSSLTDAQQQTLDAISSLLGTDPNGLLDSLKSGASSLADLFSAKGVDQSSIAMILQEGLLFDATA